MRPERRVRLVGRLMWPMLGALLAACATSPRTAQRRAVTPAMRADAALLAMADSRRADVPLLDSAVLTPPANTEDSVRQRRAVLLIGQLRLRERYPVLRSLAMHTDTALSATAVFALGLARDTASLDVLATALSGPAEHTAAEAAWALGMIGEPARSTLESSLQSAHEGRVAGHERRIALLRAVSTLRPVPTALLVPFLLDADARVAGTAAYGIARARAAGAARALLAQAAHDDASVRTHVAAGMVPALVGDSLLGDALRILPSLMRDPDMQVRVQAVRSAGAMFAAWDAVGMNPDGLPVREALRTALRDSAAPVRVTAAEGIAPVLASDELAWREAFDADTTFMVQRALLQAAVPRDRLGEPRSAWQQHEDPWRRLAAFDLANRSTAGSALAASDAIVRSAWARSDRSPRLRAAGATSLAPASDQPAVRAVLVAMLSDADPLVRASAMAALATRATSADVPRAIARYHAETTPDGHAVRAAALRVITSAWRRDSATFDARMVAALGALPVAADPLVRRGVRDVTPMAHWAAVEGPILTDADYLRVAAEWLGARRRATARLHTVRGVITLSLLPTDAPLTVDNFVQLARRQYFDGTRFHRVIAGFVAQDGDPTGTGSGGPGRSIRDELNRHRYERGAVGMALSGPDTGGSQYFLTLSPQPHLDGGYTVFARVIDGFDVMDALLVGDRIVRVEVP